MSIIYQAPPDSPVVFTQAETWLRQVLKKVDIRRELLRSLSGVLIVVSVLGLGFIYAPVVRAEVGYQVKHGMEALGLEGLRDLLLPSFSFELNPAEHRDFGIVIPKIGVNEKVVAHVDPTDAAKYSEALKDGVAHAAGTGLPGDGMQGYYFAHSADPSVEISRIDAVFSLLNKLEVGDDILIWRDGEKYEYRVSEKMIVDPSDVSFLDPAASEDTIVLQTCWPLGTDAQRLIVEAKLVD